MFRHAFFLLGALLGVAACSSSSNAGPTCVDVPVTGQTRPLVDDHTCSGMATCRIQCRCQNNTETYFDVACESGLCRGSAERCESFCADKGGLMIYAGGGTVNPPGGSSGDAPSTGTTSSSGSASSSGSGTSSGSSASALPPCPPASASSTSSSGGSTSSSSGTTSSSSGATGTSSSGGDDTPIRCESSPTLCICGRGSLFQNGSESTACSLSTIGGSGRCCASNEWPASGGCQCDARPGNCHRTFDKKTCICGIAAPGPTDESVSSCSGSICCLEPSNGAPRCTCYSNATSCLLGGTPVSSCSVADLKCEGKSVTECR